MRWVLLLASLLFALVLAEATARVVVDDVYLERQIRSGGVFTPYEPHGRADLLTSEFRVGYRINNFGHRDREDRVEARIPGLARVVLLGDSFGAGWGVSFDDTFGARFETASGIEMVNAAKNGGCPLWFVPQARFVTERFAPDWLLVQLFDNDPDDNTQFADRFAIDIGDPVGDVPRAIAPLEEWDRRIGHQVDNLVIKRRFEQLMRKLKGKRLRRTSYVKPGAKPDFEILTREESIRAHAIDLTPSRPWQGPFSVHDPSRIDEWQDRLDWNTALLEQLLEEAARAEVRVAMLYIPAYPVFLKSADANPVADTARAVARRHRVPWLDARDFFAQEPEPWTLYHAHDGHLNAAGHRLVAAGLLRELAPYVVEPVAD